MVNVKLNYQNKTTSYMEQLTEAGPKYQILRLLFERLVFDNISISFKFSFKTVEFIIVLGKKVFYWKRRFFRFGIFFLTRCTMYIVFLFLHSISNVHRFDCQELDNCISSWHNFCLRQTAENWHFFSHKVYHVYCLYSHWFSIRRKKNLIKSVSSSIIIIYIFPCFESCCNNKLSSFL